VLKQTYSNIEIILVNDGSSDGSLAICESYAEEDNRCVVINKENGGVTSARKVGVKASTGSYICFVDCDDWLDENAIELLVNEVRFHSADIVISGYINELEEGGSEEKYGALEEGVYDEERQDELQSRMFYLGVVEGWGIWPTLWAKLYRKQLIKDSLEMVDERIFYGEDAACLFPACLRADKVAVIRKAAYHYRALSATSVSAKRNKALLDNMYYLYEYLFEIFAKQKNCGLLMQQLSNYMVSIMNHAGSLLFHIPYHLQEIEWTRPQVTEWQNKYFELQGKIDAGLKNNECVRLQPVKWVFPFYEIGNASKIILYGAGTVGKSYYYQLAGQSKIKVVAWVDQNAEKTEGLITIEQIKNYEYDYIIIALKKANLISSIIEQLVKNGVERDKIIWVKPVEVTDWYVENIDK
jgi:glycosyltransferase involved in cell wall biosynthesis